VSRAAEANVGRVAFGGGVYATLWRRLVGGFLLDG